MGVFRRSGAWDKGQSSSVQLQTLLKIAVLSFMGTLVVVLSIPHDQSDLGLRLSNEGTLSDLPATGVLPSGDGLKGNEIPPDGIVAGGGAVGAPGSSVAGASSGPYGVTSSSALTASGIPVRAYRAYVRAAGLLASSDPSCKITWGVLAAIGRVESNHGRFGGSTLLDDGLVTPPILGVRLDGSLAGTGSVPDTDHGVYDGDRSFDRAVGPMQFLPGTWEQWGVDADGDRQKNPQDIDDATLAAGDYLCAGSATFGTPDGAWSAVYRYNHSDSYVSLVLSLAKAYMTGQPTLFDSPPPGVQRPGGSQATPPGPPPAIPSVPAVPPITPSPSPSASSPAPSPSTPITSPTATPTGSTSPTGAPPSSEPPTSTPPSTGPTSAPPSSEPPTSTPPSTEPTSAPPTSETPNPSPSDSPAASSSTASAASVSSSGASSGASSDTASAATG